MLQAPWLRILIATVCILLVLIVGAAHMLHAHPAGSPPEAGCSLCVVAHLSASPAPFIAGPAISAELRALPPPEPTHTADSASILAFTIRPPPAL